MNFMKMSDEEDTTNLLRSEKISIENESKNINSTNPNYYITSKTAIIFQLAVSVIAIFISGFSFGYDISITSNIMKSITLTWNLNCNEQLQVILIWMFGAFLSSLFCGILIDVMGSLGGVVVSSSTLAISAVISCTLHAHIDFIFSRFLAGISCSLLITSQLIYVIGTSNQHIRGFRIMLYFVGISMGIIISYLVGLNIRVDGSSWRIATALTAIPAVTILLISMIWLPPSPYFVLSQTAQKSVKKRNYKMSVLIEVVVISLLLITFKLLMGRYTIFAYAPQLLTLLDVCPTQATSIAIISFIILKFLSMCALLHIIDQSGRRGILLMSSIIMMISVTLLAILTSINETELSFTYLNKENCQRIYFPNMDGMVVVQEKTMLSALKVNVTPMENPPPYPPLPTPLSLLNSNVHNCMNPNITSNGMLKLSRIIFVILLFLYEVAYTFGCSTTWILLCEIFPTSIKGRGICILSAIYWLTDFFMPTNLFQIGLSFAPEFLIHIFIAMFAVIIIFLIVPETKLKSLHQIDQELNNISLLTRMFQNLYTLPYFNNSQWIEHRTRQYRHQSKASERTVI